MNAPLPSPAKPLPLSQKHQHWYDKLITTSLWQDCSPALLEHLLSNAVEQRLREGQVLYLKDDPELYIAQIVSGRLHHVLQNADGREIILRASHSGELTGESALFVSYGRSDSTIAATDSLLLILPRRHFSPLLADGIFMRKIQELLCQRLYQGSEYIESICLHRLESRLARHLLRMAEKPGVCDKSHTVVLNPPTQSTLAAMVNASRPKINAQLQRWHQAGIIARRDGVLHILNIDQLCHLAQFERNDHAFGNMPKNTFVT